MSISTFLRRIIPPIYMLVYLGIAVSLHFTAPIAQIVPDTYSYVGYALLAVTAWLNVWAIGLFKRNDTTVKPLGESTMLVITGVYCFTRNPMYLGITTGLLGIAVLLGSIVAFIAPVAFFVTITVLFIPYEEDDLEKTFGVQYLEYKSRVRRWL